MIKGLQSKPELNFAPGRILRWVAESGRWSVRLDKDGTSIAVKPENLETPVQLTPESNAQWENCRHGGPEIRPSEMQSVDNFIRSTPFQTCMAPSLGHVRELEPIIRKGAPPALVLASMGVDAFIASDFGPSRSFAVAAIVLETVKEVGANTLFRELNIDLRHRERREKLIARWTIGKCALCLQAMSTTSFQDLGRYQCSNCGKSDDDVKLRECAKCSLVSYCSTTCQEAHWPAHKADCKAACKTARDPQIVLPCGHALHRKCLDSLREKGEKSDSADADTTPPCPYCNRPLSSILAKLQQQLDECADGVEGLRRTLARRTTCKCLTLAAALGRQPAPREPPTSPVDATFDGRSSVPVSLPEAKLAGRKLGTLATTLLKMTSHKQPPCIRMREQAGKLLERKEAHLDRAASRELVLFSFEARAEAGGSVARSQEALDTMHSSLGTALKLLEGARTSAVPQNVRPQSRDAAAALFLSAAEQTLMPGGKPGLQEGSDEYEALLLAMEVLAQVGGTCLGLGAIGRGIAAQLCQIITVGSSRVPLHVTHNAMRALLEVVVASPPNVWASALEAELLLVCDELDRMLYHFLSDDPLNASCIDTPLMLTAVLTAGSASCAQRIAKSLLPTSAALVVFHHAHEQRAGRKQAGHSLGEMQHLHPINLALECLYAMSLRFDVRSVPIGGEDGEDGETERFADAFEEYAEYLHGVYHHSYGGPQQRAYLAALRERSARRVKKHQAKAEANHIETNFEHMRRQHAMFYSTRGSSSRSSMEEARRSLGAVGLS